MPQGCLIRALKEENEREKETDRKTDQDKLTTLRNEMKSSDTSLLLITKRANSYPKLRHKECV